MFLPRDHDLNKLNSKPSGDASTYVSTFLVLEKKFLQDFPFKSPLWPLSSSGGSWLNKLETTLLRRLPLMFQLYCPLIVVDKIFKNNFLRQWQKNWSETLTWAFGSGELKVDGPIGFNRFFSLRCKLIKKPHFLQHDPVLQRTWIYYYECIC